MAIVLTLCSGLVGALTSPFFEARLINQKLKAEQISDVVKYLQEKHIEMTLHGWRLTIAKAEELNRIHDAWLFSHNGVTQWLEFAAPHLQEPQGEEALRKYRGSVQSFYKLEVKEKGLSDRANRPIGQKIIAEIDANFLTLRDALLRSAHVSLF